ncbi:cyclohexanone monooxygenase [Gammaproteobacteria bacterium 42_54_T18]|nr:cyclohexanone monooxygenase [Gammaproteobacteria bacterium 42_54_T18]
MNKCSQQYDVIVVGAGFSGIGAAIKLQEAGIKNFQVLEKANEIGGVWRDNTYPGCACDIPSSLYSYSFAPNPKWSRVFAEQKEIKNYLFDVADQHNVRGSVRLNHEMLSAAWDNDKLCWVVKTSQGDFTSRFVIFACGPLHKPIMPNIPGIDSFTGSIFHSSRWDHDVDLTNKRVAVIGTGASAIQFVPQIQPKVKELIVFQRTAHWVLPKFDHKMPRLIREMFKSLPQIQKIMRGGLYSALESINGGLRFPRAMKQFQRLARRNIHRAVKDPTLRKQLTPDYVIGCKRILQSNDWYPALAKNNVKMVFGGATSIDGDTISGLSDDGQLSKHKVDAIIFGTGFEVSNPPIAKVIQGKDGKTMAENWAGSPEGYLGTMVDGCPNAFLMFGPNLAVSSSAFIIIEAQLTYIVDALKKARTNNLATIEVNPEKNAIFNDKLQGALKDSVWDVGGCTSYFIDETGRNSTVWPWTTLALRERMSRFNLHEYILTSRI